MDQLSVKCIIGIVLLFTNQPVGWGGMAFCVYLAKKTKKKYFYFLGSLIYGLSWLMLFLGAYLAGPEGVELVKRVGIRRMAIGVPVVLVVLGVMYYVKKKRKTQKKDSEQTLSK